MEIFGRFSREDFLRRRPPSLAFDRDLMHPPTVVRSTTAAAVELADADRRARSTSTNFGSKRAGIRNSTFTAAKRIAENRPSVTYSNQIRQPILNLPEHNQRAPIEAQDRRVVHVIDRTGFAGPNFAVLQSGWAR
jgi:hypothetical protein